MTTELETVDGITYEVVRECGCICPSEDDWAYYFGEDVFEKLADRGRRLVADSSHGEIKPSDVSVEAACTAMHQDSCGAFADVLSGCGLTVIYSSGEYYVVKLP